MVLTSRLGPSHPWGCPCHHVHHLGEMDCPVSHVSTRSKPQPQSLGCHLDHYGCIWSELLCGASLLAKSVLLHVCAERSPECRCGKFACRIWYHRRVDNRLALDINAQGQSANSNGNFMHCHDSW